ncbi:Glutamyl-tRNA reductase [Usitatibacter rugosus]|uniref:Glutamyl-tRNA reductase n=1 Tax=Usitatibacter rugosus TaxID=2732067 RepID=A0A6M4GQI3_9PROT|nr:glutamyl-tRNA reductase [Usitatibacter rugosus]QJR09305.1 Glutamyl-tRNA reductase [Usitatibacter rugosus]
MPLHVLGINHHTAPLEVREKIAFPAERHAAVLAELAAQAGVAEVVLVSTCNRTEVYCDAADGAAVRAWLLAEAQRAGTSLESLLYLHAGDDAVRHAFRVASGLDSMVLGEPQILGQVKEAVRTAEAAGTLGSLLHKLFQQTFAVAKRVRTETSVGAQSISMASAALKLSQNLFGDLSQRRVLLVGVGEMVELAATYFAAQRPAAIVVANRTLERGEAFAERFAGEAIALADVPALLSTFDIVVTGTASPEPILHKAHFKQALKARRHRPMFAVDFAVPRDIEPEAAELEDLFLYSIDDLGKIVQEGTEQRKAAATEAETIIASQVGAFRAWQATRAAVPVIVQLRSKAEQYRSTELAKAKARLARGEDVNAVLESLAQGLANKFLHHPTQALARAGDDDRAQLQRAIDVLFPDAEGEDKR